MSKQDGYMSSSTQMQQELKDSHTPITAGNVEITDTLYDDCNTFGKQLEPHQPSSGQLEDQAPDVTPRSSPEPEMAKKYIDMSN